MVQRHVPWHCQGNGRELYGIVLKRLPTNGSEDHSIKQPEEKMKVLCDKHCVIGEGPVWNELEKKLYQVNSFADEIMEMDLLGHVVMRKLPFDVAAIAFSRTGEMLVSCRDGAYILHPDNTRTPLYDTRKYQIKYGNDAKVGPDGRFYVGTQSEKRQGISDAVDGKLYSIDKAGEVRVLLDGLILSNGFDWSMDERYFYHTDSATKMIKEYHFNKETGELSFTGRELRVPGVDGFTIDQNDFLYVACWGRGHIAVVDTASMEIKRYIEVPAKIPASCCYAGEDMDRLVVVSASYGTEPGVDPNAGYTFICTPGTKGRKPYLFG